jgi:hypothetical protein
MVTRAKSLGFDVVDLLLLVVGIALSGLLLLLPYDPTLPTSYVEPLPILQPAGTVARAKLGLTELALAPPPASEADKRAALADSEIVRAVDILYAIDQRDLVVPIAADLAERGSDLAMLAALSEHMAQHEDARCTLLIGRHSDSRTAGAGRYRIRRCSD